MPIEPPAAEHGLGWILVDAEFHRRLTEEGRDQAAFLYGHRLPKPRSRVLDRCQWLPKPDPARPGAHTRPDLVRLRLGTPRTRAKRPDS